MNNKTTKISITLILALLMSMTFIGTNLTYASVNNKENDIITYSYSDPTDGGGGSFTYINPSAEPPSDVGFTRGKGLPANQKQRNPRSGNFGYKDNKGRYWVPGTNMHGGEGWTREWDDDSHDHVYHDGNVRKHKGTGKANFSESGTSWIKIIGLGLLTGLALLSPIPGDEIIVGGALLGL